MNRLQTGDVLQKRGSGQAAEYDHGVSAFQFLTKREGLALCIEGGDVRKILALQWERLVVFSTRSLCKGTANRNQQQGREEVAADFS